jgi:uncharacterized protein (DUF736 family)
MAEQKQDESEIGALWEKASAKGTYFTGTVNGERVVVFKNTAKKSDKAPDWRVLKAKPREAVASPAPMSEPIADSDVPF